MHTQRTSRATGHVFLKKPARNKWYMKYRLPDGRQVMKLIGPAWTKRGRPADGYYTEATATAFLHDVLKAADAGLAPGVSSRRSFGEACDAWLAYVEQEKDRAPTTLRDYRNTCRSRLRPDFGEDTPVERITREQIDAWRAALLTEGRLARRTVQKYMVILHGIFKLAKRRGWIPVNPVEDAEKVVLRSSGDFNVLTPAEIMAVGRTAGEDPWAALFVVAAFTGLRQGELRALRWCDVDFAKANIHVRVNLPAGGDGKAAPPKSQKVRSVPMIPQAATALDRLSRRADLTGPMDLVFPSALGSPLEGNDMRDRLYEAMAAAGIDRHRNGKTFVFHDLRHTFGTLAVEVWPLSDVKAYMGHADISTTMKYVHHTPKHDAAQKLGALVDAQLGVAGLPPVAVAA